LNSLHTHLSEGYGKLQTFCHDGEFEHQNEEFWVIKIDIQLSKIKK
jgi:hypothetical protein